MTILLNVFQSKDSISGWLFILCIEILALALWNLKATPYPTRNENIHLQEQYEDDLTIFLEYIEGNDDLNAQNIKYILSVLGEFFVYQVWVLIELK